MFTYQLHLCMYIFLTAPLLYRACAIQQMCNILKWNISAADIYIFLSYCFICYCFMGYSKRIYFIYIISSFELFFCMNTLSGLLLNLLLLCAMTIKEFSSICWPEKTCSVRSNSWRGISSSAPTVISFHSPQQRLKCTCANDNDEHFYSRCWLEESPRSSSVSLPTNEEQNNCVTVTKYIYPSSLLYLNTILGYVLFSYQKYCTPLRIFYSCSRRLWT